MPHNVRIARSGVYYYTRSELPTLGLDSVPRDFNNLQVFGVYRPSHVVADSAPMFRKKPVILGHTGTVYSPLDSRIIGESTDKVGVTMVNGEAVVTSELVMDAANDDIKGCELSPGYWGDYRWRAGVAPSGEQFQITLDSVKDVNHIAIVPKARGGKDMVVLDGLKKVIHSGLLRFARRRTVMTADGAGCPFSDGIDELGKTMASMPEVEVEAKVNMLLNMCTDLPDSIEKQKLQRYLADVPLLKSEPQEVIDQALLAILQLYRSLDTDAISDVLEGQSMQTAQTAAPAPEAGGVAQPQQAVPTTDPTQTVPAPAQPTTDSAPAESAPEQTTEPSGNSATEPTATTNDGLPVPTAGAVPPAPQPDANTMILQMLQQILARLGDGGAAPAAPSAPAPAKPAAPAPAEKPAPAPAENKPTTDCGNGCNTNDGLPLYSQTLATVQSGESLDALFAKMKERA